MKAVNLLPESSRPHQPSGQMGGSAYWVVGGLAVLLVMAVAYVFTANQVSSRESELTAAKAETQAAQERAATLSSFGGFAQIAQARLTSVRDLATVRFDWERVLREVAHVVPPEIWLLDMSASTSPQDSSGGAATDAAATPAGGVSPSLKISGCAPAQSDVAALMVRLRKLHDAEDVTLAESTEQIDESGVASDSAPASSDTCPSRRYKFAVTVNFEAPSAAAVAQESKDRVPVTLGGGS